MDSTQDIYKNKRPTIGEKFQVEGAKRWKEFGDVNGEVAYAGEVEDFDSNPAGIKFGTLVWSQRDRPGHYIIKVDRTHVYWCKDRIEGDWSARERFYNEPAEKTWFYYNEERTMRVTRIEESKLSYAEMKAKLTAKIVTLRKENITLKQEIDKKTSSNLAIETELESSQKENQALKSSIEKETKDFKLTLVQIETEMTLKLGMLSKENDTLKKQLGEKIQSNETANEMAATLEMLSKENDTLKRQLSEKIQSNEAEKEMAATLEMLTKENDTLKRQLSEKIQSNEAENAADLGDGTLVVASLENTLLHFNPNSFVKSETGALDYNLLDSKIQEIERLKHELDRALELHEEFKSQCKRREKISGFVQIGISTEVASTLLDHGLETLDDVALLSETNMEKDLKLKLRDRLQLKKVIQRLQQNQNVYNIHGGNVSFGGNVHTKKNVVMTTVEDDDLCEELD